MILGVFLMYISTIAENPYMQFFLGLTAFQAEPLFDSSMMVHFLKIMVAFLRRIAYNNGEPRGSKRVFRHPYPKCEALQQVFRHLYPKCGALTIRGDANPLVFCERDYRYEHPI